ncbi:unnamed protein product [Adineta steineri]|uniref:Uncharacterized protein n=1 Tax=Adineta steineri TaxID=433720 RepID=A0A814IPP7_9BILA|nr:unnamed protein product [Adineta steineri]CAF3561315.1 unnamed protein product [Adineta steineri]
MGFMSSKEQSMAKAIENQDIEGLKTMIRGYTSEEMHTICKSLVPGNNNQCTMLHFATWQDNPELLELFLDYVDDLEIRDGLGWTPLGTAVNRHSKENVKLLLKHNAKVDCDGTQGMDLIANAMSCNDIELIQILMDHGAQVTTTSETQNGCYLLHFAIDDGFMDIAKLLVERGKIPVDLLDQSGWSALHLAAGHNFADMVKFLVENGADINIKDFNGNTPLAWAREMNSKEVIDELERLGGKADTEWHGEKLSLNHYQKLTEEKQGIINSEFEMEGAEGNKSSNDNDSNLIDALQRLQST